MANFAGYFCRSACYNRSHDRSAAGRESQDEFEMLPNPAGFFIFCLTPYRETPYLPHFPENAGFLATPGLD